MPQLMPLYWSISIFMIYFIVLMMVDYYLYNFMIFIVKINNVSINNKNIIWKW